MQGIDSSNKKTTLIVVQGNGSSRNDGRGNDVREQGKGNRRQGWWGGVAGWAQHADEESYTCYILFVLIFVVDFSLLTMLFPVSIAAYALATQKPSQRYWQVAFLPLNVFLSCVLLFCL